MARVLLQRRDGVAVALEQHQLRGMPAHDAVQLLGHDRRVALPGVLGSGLVPLVGPAAEAHLVQHVVAPVDLVLVLDVPEGAHDLEVGACPVHPRHGIRDQRREGTNHGHEVRHGAEGGLLLDGASWQEQVQDDLVTGGHEYAGALAAAASRLQCPAPQRLDGLRGRTQGLELAGLVGPSQLQLVARGAVDPRGVDADRGIGGLAVHHGLEQVEQHPNLRRRPATDPHPRRRLTAS